MPGSFLVDPRGKRGYGLLFNEISVIDFVVQRECNRTTK
jgi:hypothetical protein